jgi:hypothetical protein
MAKVKNWIVKEKIDYIGEKFIGFKYKSNVKLYKGLHYSTDMNRFIGRELTITGYDALYDAFSIRCDNVPCILKWWYPARMVVNVIEGDKPEITEDQLLNDVLSIIKKLKHS